MLIDFREGGKGGRKSGRETSMCGCLSRAPYWGPGPQPRHVPWLGFELITPLVHRLAPNSLSHTSQGYQFLLLKTLFNKNDFQFAYNGVKILTGCQKDTRTSVCVVPWHWKVLWWVRGNCPRLMSPGQTPHCLHSLLPSCAKCVSDESQSYFVMDCQIFVSSHQFGIFYPFFLRYFKVLWGSPIIFILFFTLNKVVGLRMYSLGEGEATFGVPCGFTHP